MSTTEIQVPANEIRPGDAIKFGPGPLVGVRWAPVVRHSAPPESTSNDTDRIGFALGVFDRVYGYFTPATAVHTIRRHTEDVPDVWTLVAA